MRRNNLCVMAGLLILCVYTLTGCSNAAREASIPTSDPVTASNITTVAHNVTTAEDMPVTFSSPTLTDINTENVALVVKSFQRPAHGRVVASDDGSYIYTPAADFNGADAFTYTVTDGRGHEAQGTVNISVTAMNDSPVAMADAATTPRNTNLLLAATELLVNDSDIDGDALAIATVTSGSKGTATLNTDGSVTYVPQTNASGIDNFTYASSDSHGGTSAPVSVAVDIQPAWGVAQSLFAGSVSPVLIDVVTDGAGGVTEFWTETGAGGLTELWAKQIDKKSGRFVNAKKLSSTGVDATRVVVDTFGATTVMWGEGVGTAHQVWLNRLESDAWGSASKVLADVVLGGYSSGANTHLFADQREKGAICVVWDRGSSYVTYDFAGSTVSLTKGWVTPDGFTHADSSYMSTWPAYQTVIDNNGDVTVVYATSGPAGPGSVGYDVGMLRSAHYVNGKWLTVTDAFGNTVSDTKNVDGLLPSVQKLNSWVNWPVSHNLVVDQNRVVTASWSQSMPGYADNVILANRYDPKTRLWGTARRISVGAIDGLGAPLSFVSYSDMVVDKLGNITALWLETPNGAGGQLWSSRYESLSGAWGKLQRIEQLPGFISTQYGSSLLAVDEAGTVTVAWVQNDGKNQSVWFNRNEKGIWVGEQPVLAGELGTQYHLSVIQPHKSGAVTLISSARSALGLTMLKASMYVNGIWTNKDLATHADAAGPAGLSFSYLKLIEDGLDHVTMMFGEHGATAAGNKNWVVDFR